MINGKMRLPFMCLIVVLCTLFEGVKKSNAMEFNALRIEDCTIVIKGEGEIDHGDADRLRAVASLADTDSDGRRILMLNSTGGKAAAAFKVASVIDEFRFNTVVTRGDICYSACASILYLAGDSHIVHVGGVLGFHPCRIKANAARKIGSEHCNENIAKIMAEQNYPPEILFSGLSVRPLHQVTINGQTEMMSLVRAPDIHCLGLQRFYWMQPITIDVQPCQDLRMARPVRWARDWDHPEELREVLHPSIPRGLYVGRWLPPGSWSYGIFEDAATIRFRRWNSFPGGPEIEIFCVHQAPGFWGLVLRQTSEMARPTRGLVFKTRHGATIAKDPIRTTVGPFWTGDDFTVQMEGYLFDGELGQLLSGPDGPGQFVAIEPDGTIHDPIDVDVAGARERLSRISNHCAGRFFGMR
jgi:hypothetical protein